MNLLNILNRIPILYSTFTSKETIVKFKCNSTSADYPKLIIYGSLKGHNIPTEFRE